MIFGDSSLFSGIGAMTTVWPLTGWAMVAKRQVDTITEYGLRICIPCRHVAAGAISWRSGHTQLLDDEVVELP
jgi:hypothetical protein